MPGSKKFYMQFQQIHQNNSDLVERNELNSSLKFPLLGKNTLKENPINLPKKINYL
jgi:hypothetical protein